MTPPVKVVFGYANQSLDGNPCPTALLANPFAHQLAYASQMGDMKLADGTMNPGRLFEPAHDPNSLIPPTVGVVILNSLTRPLKLVESFFPQTEYSNGGQGSQSLYPSTRQPDGSLINHMIPAAQPYPSPMSHLDAQGHPALMGGVGYYSFERNYDSSMGFGYGPGTNTTIAGAMGFSTSEDGSGPLVAVAFRVKIPPGFRQTGIWEAGFSTVKADVLPGTLANVLTPLFPNFAQDGKYAGYVDPNPVSKLDDKGPGPGGLTIWACITPTDGFTVTVWVRDISSTLR